MSTILMFLRPTSAFLIFFCFATNLHSFHCFPAEVCKSHSSFPKPQLTQNMSGSWVPASLFMTLTSLTWDTPSPTHPRPLAPGALGKIKPVHLLLKVCCRGSICSLVFSLVLDLDLCCSCDFKPGLWPFPVALNWRPWMDPGPHSSQCHVWDCWWHLLSAPCSAHLS